MGGVWSHPSAVSSACLYVHMWDGPLVSHLLTTLKTFSKNSLASCPIWSTTIHSKNRGGGGGA